MLRDDLERYNETGLPRGSVRWWLAIMKQSHAHPGLIAVVVFRYGRSCKKIRVPILKQLLDLFYYLGYAFSRFILQIELPRDTAVGPGLRIDHYGGILVNSSATIGRNFTLTQGVLVGATETGVPIIGDDVHCGVGCKIIGGIELGNCIKIGAGSVVTRSCGGNAVLAGVPARVIRRLEVAPMRNGQIPTSPSREGTQQSEAAPN